MNTTNTPDHANALLDFADLPRFDAIAPEQIQPAISQLLQEAQAALEQVTQPDFAADWQRLAATLDVATERLGRAWGAVGHLKSVCDTPELRAAFNAMLPAVTEFSTALGANEALYAKYKAIDPATLDAE